MADSNCLFASFPPSTLQTLRVQNPEPEESYSVVCKITNVSWPKNFLGVAFARITTGLACGVAWNRNETPAARGLKAARIAVGRASTTIPRAADAATAGLKPWVTPMAAGCVSFFFD
jgi:hypothetical protein